MIYPINLIIVTIFYYWNISNTVMSLVIGSTFFTLYNFSNYQHIFSFFIFMVAYQRSYAQIGTAKTGKKGRNHICPLA